jgi:hypothetical protein
VSKVKTPGSNVPTEQQNQRNPNVQLGGGSAGSVEGVGDAAMDIDSEKMKPSSGVQQQPR